MTVGRAIYEPGWKWSEHVGRALGKKSCDVEHVGMVVSGCATAAMNDGRIFEMRAGDLFFIEAGHDSWVVGDEPYVSIHLMGARRLRRNEVIPTSTSQTQEAQFANANCASVF